MSIALSGWMLVMHYTRSVSLLYDTGVYPLLYLFPALH